MSEKKYVTVDTPETLREMVKHIKSSDIIAFDTETTSLNPRKGKIIGLSVSGEVGVGYYMPTMVFKDGELKDDTIYGESCHELAKKVITLLCSKKIIGHNLSFDSRFVKSFYGIDITCRYNFISSHSIGRRCRRRIWKFFWFERYCYSDTI